MNFLNRIGQSLIRNLPTLLGGPGTQFAFDEFRTGGAQRLTNFANRVGQTAGQFTNRVSQSPVGQFARMADPRQGGKQWTTPKTAWAPLAREGSTGTPVVDRPEESRRIRESTYQRYNFTPKGRSISDEVPIYFAPLYKGSKDVQLKNYGGEGGGGWAGYYQPYGENWGITLANQQGGVSPRVLAHEFTHNLSDPMVHQWAGGNQTLEQQPWKWPTNQLPSDLQSYSNWSPMERMAEIGVGTRREYLPQNIKDFYSPFYTPGRTQTMEDEMLKNNLRNFMYRNYMRPDLYTPYGREIKK